jgi:vancomycin resistance protein YoaR
MSVISNRPTATISRPHAHRGDGLGPWRRIATGLLLTAAVVSVAVILGAGALLAYGRVAHANTIFTGTNSGGVELGGKSVEEAEAALDARYRTFYDRPIPLTFDGTTLNPTPADLGVSVDSRATAEKAYEFGRQDTIWRESRNWLDALSGGTTVTPVVTIDRHAFVAYLESHAGELTAAPVDASLVLGPDGGVSIEPGSKGIALDVGETFERFQDRVATMSSEPIEIATIEVSQATSESDLQAVLDEVETLAGDPFYLNLNGAVWAIPAEDLMAMVTIQRENGTNLTFDERAFGNAIRQLEPAVFHPGTDASISNNGGQFILQPAVEGQKLDVKASIGAAVAAIKSGAASADLVTTPVQPNVTDDEVGAASAEAQRLTSRPITLTWENGSGTLDPAKLASALRFDVNANKNPNITISFDEEEMRKLLAPAAYQVKVDGKDAEFRWINNQVEVRSPEQMGRELDVKATADRVQQALTDGTDNVAIVTKDVKPQVTADMAGSVQIRDRLAESWTEYGSSVANRLYNVELATSRANGAMVAPGAIFSFNNAVGAVTYDNGYRTGYGIVGTSNGSISTIPSVGGGICQVATTAFQSVFRAGMPIEERSWHLYWIPRYGQPPSGMKGLDATVDDSYGLDFQFKNATNDWLAIKSWTDGTNVHFELWGTNQGWDVQIDQPIITNQQPASQEMVYEESDQLPAGQSVFVEHAEDGFNATIHRVVRKDGQVIDERDFVSTYAPARNVTLVGTGS